MSYHVEQRTFLVGCPRSGTTLLQSMIAAHPQIVSFPETHFLVATGKTLRGRWYTRLGLASPEMKGQVDRFLVDMDRTDMRVLLPRHGVWIRQYATALVKILDTLAGEQGKTCWLEKTPGHLHYVDLIERYIPRVQFIHIVRNGPDVVASLYQVTHEHPQGWGGVYDIDYCVDQWNHDIQLTKRYTRKTNHILVQYEQLVKNPQAVLTDVCDFIGITFNQDMIAHHSLAAEKLILANEIWKQESKQAIYRECSKFERVFTQEQRAYILERLASIEL